MAQSESKVFPVLEGNVAIVTGAAMGMGEATLAALTSSSFRLIVTITARPSGRILVVGGAGALTVGGAPHGHP